MTIPTYPISETTAEAMFDVGDGHVIHWEVAGEPGGVPVVLLHGGPGSGSTPNHRKMFDPTVYRIVQFDQRNCGQSTPFAGDPEVDFSANTTSHLVADIERLRLHLEIDRWVVWGGSWGTTLGLAYAEAHPESVLALVLGSVVTTSAPEIEWVTRSMGRVFPERWRVFRDHLPTVERDDNLALAYNRLLMDPDPAIHEPAALAWCEWEDVHVSVATGYEPQLQNAEPSFRLCFARLVTHYWGNAAFMDDRQLIDNVARLANIPTFLTHGRLDISAPCEIPVTLAAAIPDSELFIAERGGHGGPEMTEWTISVLDRLAQSLERPARPRR